MVIDLYELGIKLLNLAFEVIHEKQNDRVQIATVLRDIANEFDPSTSTLDPQK